VVAAACAVVEAVIRIRIRLLPKWILLRTRPLLRRRLGRGLRAAAVDNANVMTHVTTKRDPPMLSVSTVLRQKSVSQA
jgi:hypothetical protein